MLKNPAAAAIIFFFSCFQTNAASATLPATPSAEINIRILADAKEVSQIYGYTPEESITACRFYWINKCKHLAFFHKNCAADKAKTEEEFQKWAKSTNPDPYEGISCLQNLRWSREYMRRNPQLYMH